MIRLGNANWYHRSQARDSSALRHRLRELSTARPRFGYERLQILLVREGWRAGRNRVHRLCVTLQADHALTGQSGVDALNETARERELPDAITVDPGTEFTSTVLDDSCCLRGVKLDFMRPGKPTENSFIESFSGRLRDECPNVHELATLDEARAVLKAWQDDYNRHHPDGSLGRLTPSEFAAKGQKADPEAPEPWLRVVRTADQRQEALHSEPAWAGRLRGALTFLFGDWRETTPPGN